jgi:hypothetical protein
LATEVTKSGSFIKSSMSYPAAKFMHLRSLIRKQPSCQQRMLYPEVVWLMVLGDGETDVCTWGSRG